MKNIDEFVQKIAEEISPDEADFATIWAEAYIAGGKQRQELYSNINAQAGGFLPGDLIPVMPLIYKGLVYAAPMILAVLTSDLTGKLIDVVKNALAVGEVTMKGKKIISNRFTEEKEISESVQNSLAETFSRLETEIANLGLSQAKTNHITLTVMRILLENPLQAKAFVKELSKEK